MQTITLIPNASGESLFLHFQYHHILQIQHGILSLPGYDTELTDIEISGNMVHLTQDTSISGGAPITDTSFTHAILHNLASLDIDPVEYRLRIIHETTETGTLEHYYFQLLTINP